MPKFVQSVVGKSYSYIGPNLDWARGKVSLLDGACGKLETIVTPVIVNADKCIDTSVDAVSLRVTTVRTSVGNRVAPVQAKLAEVQVALVVRSLDFVDSSESLIDRLLPLPSQALERKTKQDEEEAKVELLSRVVRLPFAVPLRVTMFMYVKANGAVEAVVLTGRHFTNVAWDKQNQFAKQVMQRAKPLTDKVMQRAKPLTDKVNGAVASVTTPAARNVRAGKDSAVQALSDGRQMVTVKVNNVVIRLHLIEVKDWSLEKANNFKSSTLSVVMAVVRTAHGTTTRVIGHQRATTLFTKLHLPVTSPPRAVVTLGRSPTERFEIATPDQSTALVAPLALETKVAVAKVETIAKVKTIAKLETNAKVKTNAKGETPSHDETKLSNVTKSTVVLDAQEVEGAIAG